MLIMDFDEDKNNEEFLPKNPIIGGKKRSRRKKVKTVEGGSQKRIVPAMIGFADSDPFKNPTAFVSFYRSIIRSYANGKTEFPSHGADREYASIVMDAMIDIGREKDVEFLREWIKYFGNFKLKDRDFEDYKKTSIRQFSKTLEEYKKKHIDI